LAHFVEATPTPEELTKMLQEGAFGTGAVDIIETVSGPASDFAEMLNARFDQGLFDGLGIDTGGLVGAMESYGFTPISGEEALEKRLAEMEGAAFEDGDGTSEAAQGIAGGGAGIVGAVLVTIGSGGAAAGVVMLIGLGNLVHAIVREKERTEDQTSTDPEPEEEEDTSTVASKEEEEKPEDEEDTPAGSESTTTTPKDPNVDGTGTDGGTPSPEKDPNEGTTDPQDDTIIFVAVDVEGSFDEQLEQLILTDSEVFQSAVPEFDPTNLDETTQPGEDDADFSVLPPWLRSTQSLPITVKFGTGNKHSCGDLGEVGCPRVHRC
jgi:hypothetical protein